MSRCSSIDFETLAMLFIWTVRAKLISQCRGFYLVPKENISSMCYPQQLFSKSERVNEDLE